MRGETYQAVEMVEKFALETTDLPFVNHKNQPDINHPHAMVRLTGAISRAAFVPATRIRGWRGAVCGDRVTVLRNEEL